jgi:glucose/arabinose dehydrogenase
VLVAESATQPILAAPSRKGFEAFARGLVMKRVGAAAPSPNKIYLLRDADGDGVAETKALFASGLTRPFGMALMGETLFVANENGVVRFAYHSGQTAVRGPGEKVFDLHGGLINLHWTKNLLASPDGTSLYATVGANSNVGDRGMDVEAERAAIWRYNIGSGAIRIIASGLRNSVGMDFEPVRGQLWTTVNERDEIGADLPPDYMRRVVDHGFCG